MLERVSTNAGGDINSGSEKRAQSAHRDEGSWREESESFDDSHLREALTRLPSSVGIACIGLCPKCTVFLWQGPLRECVMCPRGAVGALCASQGPWTSSRRGIIS